MLRGIRAVKIGSQSTLLKRKRDAFFCYAVSHVAEAFQIAAGKAPFLDARSMQTQSFRDTGVQNAHTV
jgi:hypothetical protein